MKRKLLKRILCFTICGSLIWGLFSEPLFQVSAVSEETQNAIDQAEDEKEQLEKELKEQEDNKGQLEEVWNYSGIILIIYHTDRTKYKRTGKSLSGGI